MTRRVLGLSAIVFAAGLLAPALSGGAVFAAQRLVVVPDLVGRTEEDARQLLEAAGLAVGQITRVESDAGPGTVVSQDPQPRSQVPPNTRVAFAVAVPRMVAVPRVVGSQERDAGPILARSGLEVGEIRRQASRAPRGEVLDQEPSPGRQVAAGSAVDLVVSAPLTAVVPPIVGRAQTDAVGRLERAGLAPGTVTLEQSRSPEGTVLRQQPPAGQTVQAGTGVDMVVATPVTVTVPRLVGRTEGDAIDLLRKTELDPGAVTSEESRRPEGTVLSQQPPAGDTVAVGTPVRIVVATPVTVLVPSLVGRTQLEAGSVLTKAELVPGTVTSEESRRREGSVLSQDPAPGRRVVIGTRVNFVLARPVAVTVPSLVGRTRAQAARLLEQAELVFGDASSEESRRPPGTVLSQRPEAGATVVIGSPVAIVTATPVTTLVPDVVSRSEADARQLLEKVELAVGRVTTAESRSPAGSVLRQGIAAETRVPIGTPVDLTTAVPVTVLVPAIVGVGEQDARNRLAAVELAPGTVRYRESPRPGTVLSQAVAQGTRVPVGTRVGFVLGVVETVPVPALVGMPVEQAREALVAGRLAVGAEEQRPTHLEPEGTVLAQSVEGGTRTAIGSPIDLTVAAIEMVAVPDVVGLPHDDAAAAITAAGLTPGTVTPRFSIQAGGTVVAQALQADQQVPYGTPVPLDEARPRLIWMGPAGVLLLAGLAGLVRFRKRPSEPEKPRGAAGAPPSPPPPTGLEVRALVDAGDAEVHPQEAPAVRLEVRIQPAVDRGLQESSATAGDFIESERRERAPGAEPPEEKA